MVARLRDAGHRIESIAESSPGVADEQILARPDIGSLVLLTYDRDFGDLIFNRGLPAPEAILYTRLSRAEPLLIASRLLVLLETGVAAGHMITITKDGFRRRAFPSGDTNG